MKPTNVPPKSPFKWTVLTVGTLIGVAHIGVLGHVFNSARLPVINFPSGDYSSYKVEATRDGYRIEYKANDPAILNSERQLKLDQHKRGLFGGGIESRREYRIDQYTMDGSRNIGGGLAVITPSSSNPPFINSLLRNMPIVVGLIAFTAFSTEVFDIIQGNRDWSLYTDAVNSYMLFLASSFVAGLLSLLGNRR